jgi:hypothetical protein
MVAAMRGLFLAGLLLATPTAHADDKEHWVAQLTSVGATFGTMTVGLAIAGDDAEGVRGDIGVSLALTGLMFGPTAGHWYVGDELVTTGLCIRLGALAAIPAIMIFDPYLDRPNVSGPIITGASLVFVTGLVWDHATLPGAVRRHNGVTPVVTANGVAFAGRF